ncbi:hypothetical protein NUW54_g469 [Trametes sanguinea]|uniref:Uncharacterized protein n=2 Tax=Trametes sanguinea TaxID=158606 RepID=A0ACC1Q939_9APHY|nr:hypothetical protein NUW54_g714 [Trametes sanguinea]KAJ3017933.1 hypothetical protein NUW54_g469 [Trametes sanguinea]
MSPDDFNLNDWVDLDRLVQGERLDHVEAKDQTTTNEPPVQPPLPPFAPHMIVLVHRFPAVQPVNIGSYQQATEARHSIPAGAQDTERIRSDPQPSIPSTSSSRGKATFEARSNTSKPSTHLKENVASTPSAGEPMSTPRVKLEYAGVILGKRKALALDSNSPDSIAGPSSPIAGPSSLLSRMAVDEGDVHTVGAPQPTKRLRRTNTELAAEKTNIAAKFCGYNGGQCKHILTNQKDNRRHLRTAHYPVRHGRKGPVQDAPDESVAAKSKAWSSRSSPDPSSSVAEDESKRDTANTASGLKCTYGKECCKSFSRLNELQKHAESAHWKQRFQCDICGITLVRRDTLLRHRGGKACRLEKAKGKAKDAAQ